MRDVIEAHIMGRVRGKFHQVVCKLCYEDDSVLSMNVVGRRSTGKIQKLCISMSREHPEQTREHVRGGHVHR